MATKSDLPNFATYFPPTAEALKTRGGSATIEELEEDVARLMGLSEDVLAVPHKDSSRSQFQYELAWVRTYLKKVGLAENSERGVWSLTEIGEKISPSELLHIPKKVRSSQKTKDKDTELQLATGISEPDWQE